MHFPHVAIPRESLDRIRVDGIEIPTRNRSVWDAHVLPHELHRLFGCETFVWGGDLNSDPRMDDVPGFAGGNRRVFELYRQAGARDLRARLHKDNQRTFFAPGRGSYQLDHVFPDAATEGRVTSWQVDGSVAAGGPYSDHAAIIVDLDGS